MEIGWHQLHNVGCYITPNNASAIEDVIAAINRQTRWVELLVTGNFDEELVDP